MWLAGFGGMIREEVGEENELIIYWQEATMLF